MVSHGNYSLTWSTDRGQNTELRGNSAACKKKDGLDSLFALLLLVPSSRIHSSVNWRMDTMTFRLFGGFVLNIYNFYVAFATRLSAFKWIIFRIERDSSAQPKIKTVSSIAHPHVVPNPFDFLLLNTKDVRLYVKVWQSQSPLTFIASFLPIQWKWMVTEKNTVLQIWINNRVSKRIRFGISRVKKKVFSLWYYQMCCFIFIGIMEYVLINF